MLFGWPPHVVEPGDVVLVWGGSGGLGSLAIQLVTHAGGRAVAVVGSDEKGEYAKTLGAVGYVNRKDFDHWGVPPAWDSPEWKGWFDGAKAFGKAIWDVLGERTNPRIVFEHPGQDTIPTSNFVCDRGGMIVICAGTSGYDTMIDVRYLWFLQKRYQGSHLFNDEQAAAFNRMVIDGTVTTTLGETYRYDQTGHVHQLMGDGSLPEGNVAILVQSPEPGLKDLP
jgi:crotonyl-CoA carboxylase/reductase